MSTKIYDAYRIPKSEFPNKFIGDILCDLKQETKNVFIEDEDILKAIHVLTAVWIKEKDDEDAWERFIDPERSHVFQIKEYLDECEDQIHRFSTYFDIDFDCSVFEDEEYWYLKFFANQRWQWDLLIEWEDKYDWFQDYHYQNQSDPPEEFTYEEFKKRDDKWEELTNGLNNYLDGLQFYFMNASIFYNMMWDRDIELPYDFKFEQIEDKIKLDNGENEK